MNEIFISHRSINKEIVDNIIDYLVILGIPRNYFFCSSLPGNDIKEKISTEIKQVLESSKINIVLLSKDYYNSAYCLNEAGIIWYQDKSTIVFALSGIDENNMYGFLNSEFKIRRLTKKEDLLEVYDSICNYFNITKSGSSVINRKVDEYVDKFKVLESSIAPYNPFEIENTTTEVSDMTDDEKLVIYCLSKKLKKKIFIGQIEEYLNEQEIDDIDVENGVELLCDSGFGILNEYELDIDIQMFRNLKKYSKDKIIDDAYLSHYNNRKDMFLELYQNNSFDEIDKLFISYLIDERVKTLGSRWKAGDQILGIKKWEQKNLLTSDLSKNYERCLSKFVNNKLCYATEFTDYNNPKKYTLHKSLFEYLQSIDDIILDELKQLKEKYQEVLPF